MNKLLLMSAGFFILLLGSCKKDDPTPADEEEVRTTAVFNPDVTYGTMTDQDGNDYKTITIGTQTWMAENLRTTTYNDGTPIPNVQGDAEWAALTSGAYSVFQNKTDESFIATYGFLYNFYAIDTGKLAPAGWHVPTDAEWSTLLNSVGGSATAGKKLKEAGTAHWVSYALEATNEFGFTALPGENRGANGLFTSGVGVNAEFWTATPYTTPGWAYLWYLKSGNDEASRISLSVERGASVRLVKD